MPEHDCLPPDVTATEFVTHLGRMSGLPPTSAKERAAESLRHVGLYEERYRLIGTYSTGMKQRVKLAQALVGDPRLMLLDEPTNGLDPAGRTAMLDLMARIGSEFGISIAGVLAPARRDRADLRPPGGHRRGPAAPRRLDDQLHPGQPSAAGRGGRGHAELAAELAARGLRPRPADRGLLVRIVSPATYDEVRDTVADLGLPLHRLEQRRRRVEELFRRGDADDRGARRAWPARRRGHPRHRLPALHRAAAGPRRPSSGRWSGTACGRRSASAGAPRRRSSRSSCSW